jgi:hypothetical protein
VIGSSLIGARREPLRPGPSGNGFLEVVAGEDTLGVREALFGCDGEGYGE